MFNHKLVDGYLEFFMGKKNIFLFILIGIFVCSFVSCKPSSIPIEDGENLPTTNVQALSSPTATEVPQRLLSICMGQEPSNLFLYADDSLAARTIRQAIYDGPYDIINYKMTPVILEQIPDLTNGGIRIEPVLVQNGSLIADVNKNLVFLEEGVTFYPSGCVDRSCVITYTGQEAVNIDQVVVRFKLIDGLLWSDGTPLTMDDSRYSYELAKAYYPNARAEIISYTSTYLVLDEKTIEWRGIPGFKDAGVNTYFFTPLPRHLWGALAPDELNISEIANLPIGWGAFQLVEWTKGDHITLTRNPNYFRADEGLPAFDQLVFRFMSNREEALDALLAGECDYLDQSNHLETLSNQLIELNNNKQAFVRVQPHVSWEHLVFGILPYDEVSRPFFFKNKETRQAIAKCIDRVALLEELSISESNLINSYISSSNPFYNPNINLYPYDPQAGSILLDSIGWLDQDGDPATPRVSSGIDGITDGTIFSFKFLTTDETNKQGAASNIQANLAQCGIEMMIETLSWDELFAAGPEGPVFGRNFDMTQLGWQTGLQPPCFLFASAEIPGPYPDHPKGWGGANASGFSNQQFDLVCDQALRSLPGSAENLDFHFQAQLIFSDELPVIPLYQRNSVIVARSDICEVSDDSISKENLWNIELLNYGDQCVDN